MNLGNVQSQLEEKQRGLQNLEGTKEWTSMKSEGLRKSIETLSKKKKELDDEKRKQPWNIDTICKTGFDKSVRPRCRSSHSLDVYAAYRTLHKW